MKCTVLILCSAFILGGCVATGRQTAETNEQLEPTVVFRPTAGSYILSCLEDLGSLRSKEFNDYFRAAEGQLANGSDEDTLRFICLSLSVKANYKQFKEGSEALDHYIVDHPDDRKEMVGLRGLVSRLDQAKIARWSGRKKMLDEKEELEGEVTTLQEEIKKMQAESEQDKVRIQELRNQIEQLKNIENIIKNREHGS
ncbi:MAG TPA: hypothetical protein ENI88_03400 [Desulfobulbus sp.]|nr:hypothetical protein [Desulfobulbus sp.]